MGGKNERWREEGWEEKMRGWGGGEGEEGGENDASNLV